MLQTREAEKQYTGNVLFVAMYLAGQKHTRSKVEGNVVVSILTCVEEMKEDSREVLKVDMAADFVPVASLSHHSPTELVQGSVAGCFSALSYRQS